MIQRFLRLAIFAGFASGTLSAMAACPATAIDPATALADAAVGANYDQVFVASGSAATPYGYQVTSGLPAGSGLSMNAGTGELSGTPTQAGDFIFTITATDTDGCNGGRIYELLVTPGDQTISFTSTAPADATVGGAAYEVSATASSGLTVDLSIDGSASSVCSITGSSVTFQNAGTCIIDANQPGNANWNAAAQVQQSFTVAMGNQTITFTSTPPVGAKVNDAPYIVTATSTSGLTVTLTIDAVASSVCSLSGSSVSFNAGGTCVIDANQAGDSNWNAATQVQQSFTVAKLDQTISFTSTPVNPKNAGPTYTVSATGGASGNAVTFTIDASASSVCSVAGSVVSFIGAGTCVIDANQAGSAQYNAAAQVQQSFLVAKGDQTIGFTSLAPTYGAATAAGTPHTYTATATATSGLAVAFSTAGACSNSGGLVTFGPGAGACTISADQAGDSNWNPAPTVQQSTTVEIPVSATGDSHAVTGNVAIAPATSVTANDSGTNLAVTSYGGTTGNEQTSFGTATPTAQGGSVTMNASGTYSYDPPANFTGSDSFKYVIANHVSASTGTVTLTVSDRIMVVSSGSSGNCKPVTPTPCALSTADATAAASGKDLVFVQSGSYVAPNATITLDNNQTLVGNAVSLAQALTDAGITLATESVAIATINASATPTLTNAGNVITLGGNNLVEYFSITNSAGSAIAANAVAGTSTIHDITVTNGGNAGNGVNLTSNTGTLNFSNLIVTTSSGNAFSATGGGTVNVTTGSNFNSLTSTTGVALNVVNTTIGASGLNFRSITAGTAASGPSKGIVLNTTGSSGGLTVTGTGSAASGGAIQKASGNGVELISTKAPSLSWMNITSNTGSGIRGDFINGGLALSHLTVTSSSTKTSNCTTPSDTVNCQAVIFLYNLLGTGNTISNSTVSGGFEDNLHVESNGSNVLGGLTISNTTIADNSPTSGNDGLQIIAAVNAIMTITADSNTFHGNRATAIMANAADASSINVTLTNNAVYDAGGGTNQGNIGIDVNGAGTSSLTFNVSNNTIGKNGGLNAPLMNHGVNVFFGSTSGGSVTGHVSNNVIHNAGYGFSGFGIRLFPGNGNSVWKVRVDGNTVDNVGLDYGLFVGSGEQTTTGADVVQAGVLNNNVSVLGPSGANPGALDAIRVQARVLGSMCARISGNAAVQGAGSSFFGIFTRQANTATYNLEGGTANVAANNPATTSIGTTGTINTVAANFCSQIP